MVTACYISSETLGFPKKDLETFKKTILAIYGKVIIVKEDYNSILDLLKHDKKNRDGQLNFVLLESFEKFKLDCKVAEKQIIESLVYYSSNINS